MTTYRVREIYSDAALRAAAGGDESQFFRDAVARTLLEVPAQWRQSVLAAAWRASASGPTVAEIGAAVSAFLQGHRPPRMEVPGSEGAE